MTSSLFLCKEVSQIKFNKCILGILQVFRSDRLYFFIFYLQTTFVMLTHVPREHLCSLEKALLVNIGIHVQEPSIWLHAIFHSPRMLFAPYNHSKADL